MYSSSYSSHKRIKPMKTVLTPPPNHQPRDGWQRLLELGWGLAPFVFLIAIVAFSFFHLTLAAILLLAYTAGWFVRLAGYAYRLVGSYYRYRRATQTDWARQLSEATTTPPYQAVIVSMYNEPLELVEATVQAVVSSDYEASRIMLVIAYEARGGEAAERTATQLIKAYGSGLMVAEAVKHPVTAGEALAKAGNITYAAKWLSRYCSRQSIAASDVLVTTLDADNRPHPGYLTALACAYATKSEPAKHSFQPIPLFTNNIWDAPAPSRVMAADTSFWFMMDGLRPRRLRLFSAYAQSLQTLQDTGYWNTESIVEDGHQYWRSYFTYRGEHTVVPVWLPIYQDAVSSGGYWHSITTQFRQLLRWAWSTADTPFVIRQALRERHIGRWNKTVHIARQMDDYLSWATTPLVLAIGAWLPWVVEATRPGGHSPLAFKLFHVIIGLQLLALADLVIAIVIYLKLLPPRPPRYGRLRWIAMVLQWALEPITLIFFVSLASLIAHGRLIIGKPLEEFHVTSKVHTR